MAKRTAVAQLVSFYTQIWVRTECLTSRTRIGASCRLALRGYLITGSDPQRPAGLAGELGVTPTSVAVFRTHLPILHGAKGKISSHQEIEPGIHISQCVITHKSNTVKLLQDVTNLSGGVPPVRTTCFIVSRLLTTTFALFQNKRGILPCEVYAASKPWRPPLLMA